MSKEEVSDQQIEAIKGELRNRLRLIKKISPEACTDVVLDVLPTIEKSVDISSFDLLMAATSVVYNEFRVKKDPSAYSDFVNRDIQEPELNKPDSLRGLRKLGIMALLQTIHVYQQKLRDERLKHDVKLENQYIFTNNQLRGNLQKLGFILPELPEISR